MNPSVPRSSLIRWVLHDAVEMHRERRVLEAFLREVGRLRAQPIQGVSK